MSIDSARIQVEESKARIENAMYGCPKAYLDKAIESFPGSPLELVRSILSDAQEEIELGVVDNLVSALHIINRAKYILEVVEVENIHEENENKIAKEVDKYIN